MKNALRLYSKNAGKQLDDQNPITLVFKLVEKLGS